MATKNILFLATGGTIAGQSAKLGDSAPLTAEDIKKVASESLSHIETRWGDTVEPTAIEICNVDSSDILPTHWTQLANAIEEHFDEFDGFIITHGTNTMAYTAAALAFAIANSAKPIVITGSQIPASAPGSDGKANIDNALRIAAYPDRKFKGVLTVFGSHIITGVRTKKSTEFDIDAFQSFTSGSLGRIGRILNIIDDNLARHESYLTTTDYNPARRRADLRISADFKMDRILSLTEFPGMSSDLLLSLIPHDAPLDGVVFRAFGAGDASSHVRNFFHQLKERHIPIVVTTQAPNGKATLQVNEPGQLLAKDKLAIAAHDMSIESMTVKLGWLTAQGHSYDEIVRLMSVDMRGEINKQKEEDW